jgi:hypothetical protein
MHHIQQQQQQQQQLWQALSSPLQLHPQHCQRHLLWDRCLAQWAPLPQ